MTAATPIWKGIMVDTDSRWQRYGDITDDRSPDKKDDLVCFSVPNILILDADGKISI